jgi:2-dehydro-3-deoxyphosphogluconate aldolase/(4S)-4-hydroxy-2-oxoglutarate aldolase
MRQETIDQIKKEKLIVIVRGIERKKLIPLAEAMYNGGIRLLEVTYSANGKVSDEKTAENIRALVTHFGNKMCIGAGTVLTEKQVELTQNAGGCFIISPNTKERVIQRTVELGMVSIPGAFSPSEIEDAHEFGADFVKLFPVTNLGAEYVKAVKAPLSHIDLLAVGGIDLDNIPLYKKAGACGFGVGSNITDKSMIANEDWQGIAELAKQYSLAVKGD